MCKIFQPIMFELIFPDTSAKLARNHAHLKPVMQDKPFAIFENLRVHDQNYFREFGIIPTCWDEPF